VIYGRMLIFANFASGLARPTQVHSLLPCRQFAVVGVVFTHSNVVVLAQADVAVRGPITGRQAVPQRVASTAATAVLVAAAAMMVASPAAAAAAAVVLEATSPVAVTAPAEAAAAAAEAVAAAPAFASLLVVVVVLLGGSSGGHEGARDLALQVDSKLLLQLAAGEERLLPLPGGGVHSQNIVYELHQFWDAEGVVFQLWQAEVGGVEKTVDGFEGEVPWHDYPCQAA